MALGIVLGVVILGLGGLVGWLVYRGDQHVRGALNASDIVAATREELGKQVLEGERLRFELKQTKASLDHYRTLTKNLEDYVATQAFETDESADLAPDDVAGRLVRVVRQQRRVIDADSVEVPGPATAGDPVRPELVTDLR